MDISIAAICLENGSVAQRWGVRPGRRPGPADSLEPLHPAAAVHGQRFDKKHRPDVFNGILPFFFSAWGIASRMSSCVRRYFSMRRISGFVRATCRTVAAP